MELLSSPTSPYARKVRIVISELKLEDRIKITNVNTNTDEIVPATNPLGKIPTLIRPGEPALFDSYVICCYLDQLAGERITSPIAGRIDDLRLHALTNGMIDAAWNRRIEGLRPSNEQSPSWMKKWEDRVLASCKLIENEGTPPADFDTIGRITLACALGYLDLRFATEIPWRLECPQLSEWHLQVAVRDSFHATSPD